LELAEGALAEAYVDGELSPEDRQRFERHYLTTPERCRQVTVLRLVRDRARTGYRATQPTAAVTPMPGMAMRSAARPSPAWTAALAATLCLAVGWSAWLMVRQASLEREFTAVTRQRAEQQRTVSQMSEEIARLSARAAELQGSAVASAASAVAAPPSAAVSTTPPSTTEYDLRSGILRDAGTLVRVTIPPGAAVVRLRLPLSDAVFPSYRATLVDEDGNERWSVSRLVAETTDGVRALHLVAATELLPPGDYELRVSGAAADGHQEPIATYPFRRPS
jgi:uncharacterized coiled-coil protein SlyX